MSLISKESAGAKIPLLDAGTYPAVCVRIADLGIQETEYQGVKRDKAQVVFGWEIVGEKVAVDGNEVPRIMYSKAYTNSLDEKATLRRDLESWRGRAFTKEELCGFHLSTVINAPCFLNIIHMERRDGGGEYATIKAVMPLPKGMPKPKAETIPMTFDADTDGEDELDAFPGWIKDRVRSSITWQGRFAAVEDGNSPISALPEDDEALPF